METAKNRIMKTALLLLCAFLLLIANLRFGYAVVVDGRQYGLYSGGMARRYIGAAEALAHEVSDDNTVPDYGLRLKLLSVEERAEGEGEPAVLVRALLGAIPDIVPAFAVHLDGDLLGYVGETSELYELIDTMLYGAGTPYAVSVSIAQELTLTPAYVRLGAPLDAATVMLKIREAAVIEVIELDSDLFIA